tara:strand:- start:5435 stop:5776 length:342 start_codon:yes stop_codon:yes gene_type:complete
MEDGYMPRLHCRVEGGNVILPKVDVDDGEYYFELKAVGVRSGQQNNYYWNIIDILSEELGYTKQEMHETIKEHFNIESTKALEPKEFSEFIEQLIRWSAIELYVVIKDPYKPV